MKKISTLVFVLLLCVTQAKAQDLKLKIFFIDSPDKLNEVLHTPFDHTPTIQTINEIKKNQLVHAGFAVTGYKIDADKKLCLDLDVRIIDPNGHLIFSQEPFMQDKRVVSREDGQILMDGLLDFLIETNDPSGTYQVSARLIDGNKKSYALDNYEIFVEN